MVVKGCSLVELLMNNKLNINWKPGTGCVFAEQEHNQRFSNYEAPDASLQHIFIRTQ